jgi:hypothetical protein
MVSYIGPSGPNAAPLVEMGINDDDVNVYQVMDQMKVKLASLAMFLVVVMELSVKFDIVMNSCVHR